MAKKAKTVKTPKVAKAPKQPKEAVHEQPEEQTAPEAQGVLKQAPEAEPEPFRERPETPISERIAESRKALNQPLSAGQAFFESPDGEIVIGEENKGRAWSRTMNNGQGGWANPRR